MDNYEMPHDRRQLVELLEDLTSQMRNGCSKGQIITMLETATEEAEQLERGD